MCEKPHVQGQGHHPVPPGDRRVQVPLSKPREPPKCPQAAPLPPASPCVPSIPTRGGSTPPPAKQGPGSEVGRQAGSDLILDVKMKSCLCSFLSFGLNPPPGPPHSLRQPPRAGRVLPRGVTGEVGGEQRDHGTAGQGEGRQLAGGSGGGGWGGGVKPNAPHFPFLLSSSWSQLPWADVSFVPARGEGTPPPHHPPL